ncbi:hypothetical protein NP511_09720 [Natrinema thermotolerans]|uniref:Uncharacterized protein n=1 Tax=Natrinema thermotolerans TaxID=121872 RepID=A0AAF0T7Z3_9EURY|nr:hypothetical protein [Natrinema thermotolerans]WMT09889.1 hypothetical protein NP511_09720 [Natrinema thermotolerans]
MPKNISERRRKVVKGILAVGSTTMAGTASAGSSPDFESGPESQLRRLTKKHGKFRIGRGYFLNDENEVIVDTTGKRHSGFDANYRTDVVKFKQQLHFEDGYSTHTETELRLDKKQQLSTMSTSDSLSDPHFNSGTLVSKVGDKKYENTFSKEEFINNSHISREVAQSNEGVNSSGNVNSNVVTSNSGLRYIGTSDDGTEDLDQGLPVINSVGANYKTSDNRCGVSQRSTYLTVNSGATAEVYQTISVDQDLPNATVEYEGDVEGVVSSVGMGGSVTAEGFVRDNSGERSTLIMDISTGIAEIPFITNSGDVDEGFGPNAGTVGDQSYLDYQMTTDIEAGNVEVGVRMNVEFNGLRGGITQTNFMPAEQFYQPSGLGTRYSSITIDY